MPGVFFGQYPVPPPPPYMNQINGNPINVSNMQMIGSYPMMMNAQTGTLLYDYLHISKLFLYIYLSMQLTIIMQISDFCFYRILIFF